MVIDAGAVSKVPIAGASLSDQRRSEVLATGTMLTAHTAMGDIRAPRIGTGAILAWCGDKA